MDVFQLRNRLVDDYSSYIRSFIQIRNERIHELVDREISEGLLWPDPLIQLNPSFQPGKWIEELADEGVLHDECRRVFRIKKDAVGEGAPLRLHTHQEEAVRIARTGSNYVLTTGTGSGKSLAYIVPSVDRVIRNGSGKGIQAIVVYPMNALANSQWGELEKFLCHGYPDGKGPVTFELYTGQQSDEDKQRIMANPPDILLTNYVMLELILTRPEERRTLVQAAQGLKFLVLDELHTYRGRQGADVAMLVRRVRDALAADNLQCVGTSATLAGPGTYEEQRAKVAEVAALLFGDEVRPEHVIGETLRRISPERRLDDTTYTEDLRIRLTEPDRRPPTKYDQFISDPLSIWIESTFGVQTDPVSDRLVRAEPCAITGEDGAASRLSRQTGVSEQRCVEALKEGLLAGYRCEPHPDTGFPVFAFRLHQFIGRGDTVHATIEPEDERYITVRGQRFAPHDRDKRLLPLVFCRECGQEFYSVYLGRDAATGTDLLMPRDLQSNRADNEGDPGFLYLNTRDPWPDDPDDVIARVPDDWIEEHRGSLRIRYSQRKNLPSPIRVGADARESANGIVCHYIPAPFRFCPNCGIAYGSRQTSDFGKLSTLSSEGRSTATTLLSLSTIRALRDDDLPQHAKKLLSFTDNRQDASLQAGHFNDFVEIGTLRSALYLAVQQAGKEGIAHEELTQRVFDALDLPFEEYAADPTVRFQARMDTERSLRDVLGYRLYYDLRRGWRITSPNLEQCGLLEIDYVSLREVCEAEDIWEASHPALKHTKPADRIEITKTLLDFMRRELVVNADYLERRKLEQIQHQSNQRLASPWAIDEDEKLEHAARLFPRPRRKNDYLGETYMSARGGYGQYLRRKLAQTGADGRLSVEHTGHIIQQILENLRIGGLVERVSEPRDETDVPGYQVVAAAMRWKAGEASRAFHDPIRVPNQPEGGSRTNPFFVDFYRTTGNQLVGFEAREHTAQVPYENREEREERFRTGALPILFCSPTMELGVDIAQLNVVNLRNIPPTPANYAQRSGRAGRSGQPALVFSYCTTGSSHDQYFFKRPKLMVFGAVAPPRIDLANEDLIRSHVHAIWLAEAGLKLGASLKDILDLSGEQTILPLLPHVKHELDNESPRARATQRAQEILATIQSDLDASDWFSDGWLDEVIRRLSRTFEDACQRWRDLYRAAMDQRDRQNRIVVDASRTADDRAKAKRLRQEAESQLELLTQSENLIQADFYSYRYFASEGFLPGYSFPRLPLSAYIPGRRRQKGRDEFLSRSRFLAISEFGPRSIVYHEGSKYSIHKVILPVGDDVLTGRAKLCPDCGYLHPISGGPGPDLCHHCQAAMQGELSNLFRLQNVSTKRRERINCDEEERVRLGYDLCTTMRFVEHGGRPSRRVAGVTHGGEQMAQLIYGQAAKLWRINLGWTRRKTKEEYGFMLDTERGFWQKNEKDEADEDDPLSPKRARVIPFVEDHRNCLLLQFDKTHDRAVMASLQAAIKNAIQVTYQLEDGELAAEPLPNADTRRSILLYESAEGGAGILRQLVEDPRALGRVAREALSICHFDPDTGDDVRRAPGTKEDCGAACYDCMMSYSNQREHELLDRHSIRDVLLQLAAAEVEAAPAEIPRAEHLAQLKRVAGSELEKHWLDWLETHELSLPSRAQTLVEECHTRPDFMYDQQQTAIYVDGPPHDFPQRKDRDRQQTENMEDYGYTVIRFSHDDDWMPIVHRYPHVFGTPKVVAAVSQTATAEAEEFEADLFPEAWQPLLASLAELPDVDIEPGSDVTADGRVVGNYVAEITCTATTLLVIDAASETTNLVDNTLRNAGKLTVIVDPAAPDAAAKIQSLLGGP